MERVRVVDGEPRLVGGRCDACGHATFPLRERCPACRAEGTMREATLGPDGVVESAVELYVSTEEAEAPYTLGLVSLDGVTILARIQGADAPGAAVRLAADEETEAFWFDAGGRTNGASATTADDRPSDGGDPR